MKRTSTLLFCILITSCGGGASGSGSMGGTFSVPAGVTDTIFRSCLESQAKVKGWRNNTDVKSISCPRQDNSSSYGAGIVSLAGIQAFANLEEIFVEGSGNHALGQLGDLSPLSSMPRLHTIEVLVSDIRSFESIRGMNSLRKLTLILSNINDISALPSMPNLRYLNISGFTTLGAPIADFDPISQLSNLEELHLVAYEPVRDYGLGFLAGLTNLKVLDISENFLTDLNGLQHLPNLEALDLSYSFALNFNLAPQNEAIIAALTNLRSLRYAAFDGQSLGFISNMDKLETLVVTRYYGLSDMDLLTIGTLTTLKELYLEGFANADISLLQGLSNLELLWLADGTVDSTTLAFPASLTSLREIHMNDAFHYHYLFGDSRGDFKNSYEVFKDLPSLSELHLVQPWLSSAAAVTMNPNIGSLSMVAAFLDDLTFLQDVAGIRQLDLSSNPFTELNALASMPDLDKLTLNSTQVSCAELDEFRAAASSVVVISDLNCP